MQHVLTNYPLNMSVTIREKKIVIFLPKINFYIIVNSIAYLVGLLLVGCGQVSPLSGHNGNTLEMRRLEGGWRREFYLTNDSK